MKKKGQLLGSDTLVPWLIGIGVLIVVVMFYVILNDKGLSWISRLKDFWGFGR